METYLTEDGGDNASRSGNWGFGGVSERPRYPGATWHHPSSNNKALVDGLVVDGIDGGVAIIPYYAPGLLARALRNTVDQSQESITRALTAFMRFLSLVLADAKPQPGIPGTVAARDLSFVQDLIKGRSFRERPEILETVVLPWK